MDLTQIWEMLRPLWLVWLMILFAGVIFWAYRPRNKKRFEEDGMIPFKEENGG